MGVLWVGGEVLIVLSEMKKGLKAVIHGKEVKTVELKEKSTKIEL